MFNIVLCRFVTHNALNVCWGAVAGQGSTLAMRKKFSASNFLKDVRKFKATSFIYIGEICRYLMNQPPKPDDADNRLRPVWETVCVRISGRPLKSVSALKRCSSSTVRPKENLLFTNILNRDCTVGLSLTPFATVAYDTDNDEPVKAADGFMIKVKKGEVGLLLAEINGKHTLFRIQGQAGYQEKNISRCLSKGRYMVNFGDLVFNQGFRHVQFVDRIGDTFRWKGENVSTSEVEKVLLHRSRS